MQVRKGPRSSKKGKNQRFSGWSSSRESGDGINNPRRQLGPRKYIEGNQEAVSGMANHPCYELRSSLRFTFLERRSDLSVLR